MQHDGRRRYRRLSRQSSLDIGVTRIAGGGAGAVLAGVDDHVEELGILE
jgi:hypothetical protein